MTKVFVKTEDDIDYLEDVADIAEVVEDRLQVVYRDETQEMRPGWIFGAEGRWKLWFERDGDVSKYLAMGIMAHPDGTIQFKRQHGENWVAHDSLGRIRRLKLSHL